MDQPEPAGNEPHSTQVDRHLRLRNASESEIYAKLRNDAMFAVQPFPILADQFVEVRTENLERYFKNVRHSIVQDANRKKQATQPNVDSIISEQDFVLLCSYLTDCRVSWVFQIFCGRAADASLIPRDFAVIDFLADQINRIGVVTVQEGAYRVCPRPRPNPVDPDPEKLKSILIKFAALIESARACGLSIGTGTINSSIEGSSWWFLTARSSSNSNIVVANESEEATISACHREWTILDAVYCCRIRNQYDGLLPVEKMLKWTMGVVRTESCSISMPKPEPTRGNVYVKVFTEKMIPFFAALRRSLLSKVQPDWQNHEADTVISEDNFTHVCRFVSFRRVDRIYRTVRIRDNEQLPGPSQDEAVVLPHLLCDIINRIGVVKVHDGQYIVCPRPEYNSSDAIQPPSSVVWNQFNDLVGSAKRGKFIKTGTLSSSIDGTSWWFLTARNAADRNVIASESNEVVVFGSHKEWTVYDGFCCALVQNQFNGILPIENTLKWSIGTVHNVPQLRNFPNLPVVLPRVVNMPPA